MALDLNWPSLVTPEYVLLGQRKIFSLIVEATIIALVRSQKGSELVKMGVMRVMVKNES